MLLLLSMPCPSACLPFHDWQQYLPSGRLLQEPLRPVRLLHKDQRYHRPITGDCCCDKDATVCSQRPSAAGILQLDPGGKRSRILGCHSQRCALLNLSSVNLRCMQCYMVAGCPELFTVHASDCKAGSWPSDRRVVPAPQGRASRTQLFQHGTGPLVLDYTKAVELDAQFFFGGTPWDMVGPPALFTSFSDAAAHSAVSCRLSASEKGRMVRGLH